MGVLKQAADLDVSSVEFSGPYGLRGNGKDFSEGAGAQALTFINTHKRVECSVGSTNRFAQFPGLTHRRGDVREAKATPALIAVMTIWIAGRTTDVAAG